MKRASIAYGWQYAYLARDNIVNHVNITIIHSIPFSDYTENCIRMEKTKTWFISTICVRDVVSLSVRISLLYSNGKKMENKVEQTKASNINSNLFALRWAVDSVFLLWIHWMWRQQMQTNGRTKPRVEWWLWAWAICMFTQCSHHIIV